MALLNTSDVSPLLPDQTDTQLLDIVINDVENFAHSEIPELSTATLNNEQTERIKSIYRHAVVRYINAGTGAVVTESAPGGYSQTVDATALRRGGLIYARELDTIRKILGVTRSVNEGKAIVLGGTGLHADWCNTRWGAACDCPYTYPSLGW